MLTKKQEKQLKKQFKAWNKMVKKMLRGRKISFELSEDAKKKIEKLREDYKKKNKCQAHLNRNI